MDSSEINKRRILNFSFLKLLCVHNCFKMPLRAIIQFFSFLDTEYGHSEFNRTIDSLSRDQQIPLSIQYTSTQHDTYMKHNDGF